MLTQEQIDFLEQVEESALRLYQEAHLKANSARKEFARQQLKERKIELNKTRVYVTNYNAEEVRAIVTDVTKCGRVICMEVDGAGRMTSKRQAACCRVFELHVVPNFPKL